VSKLFKLVPLAVVAVLAFAAFGASAASAAEYKASSYPTTATGESASGNDVFNTEAGKVECKANYSTTLTAASKTLTAAPTYTGCKAFGFLEATVAMNGCTYRFNEPTGSFSATVNIVCGATPIKITAATCTATVGSQLTGGSVALTNNAGPPKFVTEKASVTGVAYTVTNDGLLCPFSGTGPKTGATYTQGAAVSIKSTNGAGVEIG
jgi:hypothetical protein